MREEAAQRLQDFVAQLVKELSWQAERSKEPTSPTATSTKIKV